MHYLSHPLMTVIVPAFSHSLDPKRSLVSAIFTFDETLLIFGRFA
jgi:hypothetical protein